MGALHVALITSAAKSRIAATCSSVSIAASQIETRGIPPARAREKGTDRSAGAEGTCEALVRARAPLERHKCRTNGLAADRRRLRLLLHLSGVCTELTNSMHLHLCYIRRDKNL
jgi:hypothetical protein